MKCCLSFVAVCVGFFSFVPAARAQPPIGFERWIGAPDTGVVFNQEFADLFDEYSNPGQTIYGTLFAPGIPKVAPDKRLIDIEVHTDGPFAHNVVDAVWVENSGMFQMDSWLVNRMTQQQLLNWTRYTGYVMLDIERYYRNGTTFWAGILQRNPHNLEWDIYLGVTVAEINLLATDSDMRVVDVDFVGYECPARPVRGEACVVPIYDAVVVKNTGANQIDWNLEEGWNYDEHVAGGYVLIDREKDEALSNDSAWFSAYLSVGVDKAWSSHEFLSAAGVAGLLTQGYKVIDLELDPAIKGSDPGFPSYYVLTRP